MYEGIYFMKAFPFSQTKPYAVVENQAVPCAYFILDVNCSRYALHVNGALAALRKYREMANL